MAFWSGEKLRQNLSRIVDCPNLEQIDCAAYTLRIGPEVYVTPHQSIPDPQSVTKRHLGEKENFTIPAGQFAFLLTEESVRLPDSCLGFISVKATTKFKGLVNVSGFHVDPGFHGRLIFSVFNAGPAPLHLQRGDQLFLLWIADLDDSAKPNDARTKPAQKEIPTKLINNIPGEIHSLQSLSDQIHDLDKKVDRVYRDGIIYAVILAVLVGILLRGPIAIEFGRLYDLATQNNPNYKSIEVNSGSDGYPSEKTHGIGVDEDGTLNSD